MTLNTGYRGRIIGLDVARALALIGMFFSHLYMPESKWGEIFLGYPSALFAVLAGVSLGIMSQNAQSQGRDAIVRTRYQLVMRGVALIVLGYALMPFSGSIEIVLISIGWSYIFLHPVANWSTKNIALATGVIALASIVAHTLSAFVQLPKVLLPGYPLFTWMTYFAVGLLIYRLLLNSKQRQLATLIVGTVASVAGIFARQLPSNMELLDTASLTRKLVIGFIDAIPHGGGLIDLLASCGASAAVIALCLLLFEKDTWVSPLQAMGSMSLTVYVAHVLSAGQVLSENNVKQYPIALVVSIVVALVFATVWKEFRGRGPLESLMRKFVKTISLSSRDAKSDSEPKAPVSTS